MYFNHFFTGWHRSFQSLFACKSNGKITAYSQSWLPDFIQTQRCCLEADIFGDGGIEKAHVNQALKILFSMKHAILGKMCRDYLKKPINNTPICLISTGL